MPTGLSPAQAWQQLKEGNTRFVNNTMEHPSQGFDRREELRVAQHPVATFLGVLILGSLRRSFLIRVLGTCLLCGQLGMFLIPR